MRRAVAAFLACAALAVPLFPAGSAGAAGIREIDVVSYNVLAPPWASPVWYPEIDDPSLLDTAARRERIRAFLRSARDTAELVCLQEVAASELPAFAAALGPGFVGAMSFNDPDFWSDWVVPPIPWEPNGTALFARTSAFTGVVVEDRALGTGNHAALLTATHVGTGARLRAWSLHLDSDRTNNRRTEIETVFGATPPEPHSTDVLCGDMNEDTVVGSLAGRVRRAGFVDVLAAVGNRDATHPWSETYYSSPRWAILDHVLVRGATPLRGTTIDAGVAAIPDQSTRIEELLRRMGSDHYPVEATVRLP